MAKHAPRKDAGESDLEVGDRKTHAAGVPGVYHALKMSKQQMGVRRTALTLARLNQKKGFDCPGCAWPDPDHRSPFEFCENGAKAVAEEATLRRVDRGLLRHPPALRARARERLVPRAAGPDHRALPQAGRPRPLPADRLGRGVPAGRRAAQGTAHPRRGELLHERAHVERGGVPLPADGPPLRHEQPPRLLQHVPRVVRRRARALDRDRQGHGPPGGRVRRRPGAGRRAEPRHQPPTHAERAGAGQDRQRGGRGPHHQHQPARRGRAAALPQPAEPQGHGQGHRPRRRLLPGAAHRRPGPLRDARQADHRGGCGRRGVRRRAHLGVRRVRRVAARP